MKQQGTRIGVVAVGLVAVVGIATSGIFLTRSSDAALPATDRVVTETLSAAEIAAVHDPYKAGDPLPEGFRQLLGRDQIEPVYDPQYTSQDQVDWPDDMLILGVEGSETTKAYPITHLNQHEMVIDDIDGLPILVSW